jgi:biotin transport system substrate-specific component
MTADRRGWDYLCERWWAGALAATWTHASNTEIPMNNTTTFIQSRAGFLTRAGRVIAILLVGSGLITVAAKVTVPVWPVPITLQTLAIALIAALAGSRLAVGIVGTYIVQGLIGLPVFASGGGLGYLAGPTGGFILAYLPMAYIIGLASDRGALGRPVLLLATMLLADITVMGVGFVWLLSMAGSASWIDPANPAVSAWQGAVEPSSFGMASRWLWPRCCHGN